MAGEDKHWASKAIIDPLTEPEPSAMDGPGTHFTRSTPTTSSPGVTSTPTSELSSNNPFRRSAGSTATNSTGPTSHRRHSSTEKPDGASVHTREVSNGSKAGHSSRASNDLRKEAFVNETNVNGRRRAGSNPHGSASNSRQASTEAKGRPRRSSSLKQRYPGDTSDQPLDMLKKDNKLAHRSPHLRKNHQPRPDTVDVLDDSTPKYHHEGPYDAALLVRNTSYTSSPVAALKLTNEEALKATPDAKIKDSLNDHRPLDGTAIVPPGHRDAFGQLYDYEEGTDLMREPGADYKRWPGVKYLPEDLKGKGEPSYSIEKALKEHDQLRPGYGGDDHEIELAERPKPTDEPNDAHASGATYGEWERERQRSSKHSRKVSDGIKRRVGSLQRKDK